MNPQTVFTRLAGEFNFDYQLFRETETLNGSIQSNNHLMLDKKVLFSFYFAINSHHDHQFWSARSVMTFNNKEQRFERLWVDIGKKGCQSLYFGQLIDNKLVFYPAKGRETIQDNSKITYDFSDLKKISIIKETLGINGKAEKITATF